VARKKVVVRATEMLAAGKGGATRQELEALERLGYTRYEVWTSRALLRDAAGYARKINEAKRSRGLAPIAVHAPKEGKEAGAFGNESRRREQINGVIRTIHVANLTGTPNVIVHYPAGMDWARGTVNSEETALSWVREIMQKKESVGYKGRILIEPLGCVTLEGRIRAQSYIKAAEIADGMVLDLHHYGYRRIAQPITEVYNPLMAFLHAGQPVDRALLWSFRDDYREFMTDHDEDLFRQAAIGNRTAALELLRKVEPEIKLTDRGPTGQEITVTPNPWAARLLDDAFLSERANPGQFHVTGDWAGVLISDETETGSQRLEIVCGDGVTLMLVGERRAASMGADGTRTFMAHGPPHEGDIMTPDNYLRFLNLSARQALTERGVDAVCVVNENPLTPRHGGESQEQVDENHGKFLAQMRAVFSRPLPRSARVVEAAKAVRGHHLRELPREQRHQILERMEASGDAARLLDTRDKMRQAEESGGIVLQMSGRVPNESEQRRLAKLGVIIVTGESGGVKSRTIEVDSVGKAYNLWRLDGHTRQLVGGTYHVKFRLGKAAWWKNWIVKSFWELLKDTQDSRTWMESRE